MKEQQLSQKERNKIQRQAVILRHLKESPSNTVTLSGSNKRQIATLYVSGYPTAAKVRPDDVRELESLGMIRLDKAKSNTTDAHNQWQTFRGV